MSIRRQIAGMLFGTGAAFCSAAYAVAETKIDNQIDEMNEHYAVASKHYGDGKVQIHSRADGDKGSTHTVFTVNCRDQTFRKDYEADEAPEVFPMENYNDPAEPLNRTSATVPVAQYACAEHGHPLLEWRW